MRWIGYELFKCWYVVMPHPFCNVIESDDAFGLHQAKGNAPRQAAPAARLRTSSEAEMAIWSSLKSLPGVASPQYVLI